MVGEYEAFSSLMLHDLVPVRKGMGMCSREFLKARVDDQCREAVTKNKRRRTISYMGTRTDIVRGEGCARLVCIWQMQL